MTSFMADPCLAYHLEIERKLNFDAFTFFCVNCFVHWTGILVAKITLVILKKRSLMENYDSLLYNKMLPDLLLLS